MMVQLSDSLMIYRYTVDQNQVIGITSFECRRIEFGDLFSEELHSRKNIVPEEIALKSRNPNPERTCQKETGNNERIKVSVPNFY